VQTAGPDMNGLHVDVGNNPATAKLTLDLNGTSVIVTKGS
jgi:hypothetical protein